jgi:ribonuclease HI
MESAFGPSPIMGDNLPEVTELATIHFDGGGQSPGPVVAACTVELSDGSSYEDVERYGQGTHNIAEYQALILGLLLARKHGARDVVVKGDSTLVVKQVTGEWRTKHPTLQPLRAKACDLLEQFDNWRVEWIPRKENRRADELGRRAMSLGPGRPLAAASALDEKQPG